MALGTPWDIILTYGQGREPLQEERLKIMAKITRSQVLPYEGMALELGTLSSHHGDGPQRILERRSIPELSFSISSMSSAGEF